MVRAWRRWRRELAAGIKSDMPGLERPWLRRWDHLPKRRAGADFTRVDYAAALARALCVLSTRMPPPNKRPNLFWWVNH